MTSYTGLIAPFAFIIVAVPPLNTALTLYSLWLSLKRFANALTRSLLAPVIACHHCISTTACAAVAAPANANATAIDAMRLMREAMIPPDEKDGRLWSRLSGCDSSSRSYANRCCIGHDVHFDARPIRDPAADALQQHSASIRVARNGRARKRGRGRGYRSRLV